ncbi:MAG: hypothetical protein ACK502_08160 [Alphaproteobacteria bacterium]
MEEKRQDLTQAQQQANALLDKKLADVITLSRVKQIFELLGTTRGIVSSNYREEYLANPKAVIKQYEDGKLSILDFPPLNHDMTMLEALGNLWADRNGVYLENWDAIRELAQSSPERIPEFMSKTAKVDMAREKNILNVLLAVDNLARNGIRPTSATIQNGIAALQSRAKEYKEMDAYYTKKSADAVDTDFMESLQQGESATDVQILSDIHAQTASALSKIATTLGIEVRQPRK